MADLSDQNRHERVERHLTGRLDTEGAEDLEADLAKDEALQRAYEDVQIAQALAHHYGLREDIKAVRRAMQAGSSSSYHSPASSTKIRSIRVYLGQVAAGAAILMIGFLGFQYATLSSEDLYTEKATAYQLSVSRAPQVVGSSQEEQLEQQYQAGNYPAVTARYQQLKAPSVTAVFLAGQAYLQTSQPQLAIRNFRRIAEDNNGQDINRFQEDAEYYLALSYLQANQVDQALPYLETIHDNPQHSYHALVTDYYLWKVRFLDYVS